MVSVIIPVYNVERYLERCLDSVVNQTYRDIEIILIDDGSKDRSGEICDRYAREDPRVCVYHKKNQGVSSARNDGIKRAQGEWVLFVDSDDWIDKRLLEICFQYITIETDICLFGFREVRNADEGQRTCNKNLKVKKLTKADFLGLQYRIFNRDRDACCDRNIIKLSSPCKLFRTDILRKNNIYFVENLVNGEDGVFNLYAYQYADAGVCIEEELYFYYVREDSVTHKYTPNVEEDFRNLHDEYLRFIQLVGEEKLFEEVLKERYIWSFSFCCILKYCHPDNTASFIERRKQFLAEYFHYEEMIKTVSLKRFGTKKKIIFYFIKKRNFFVVSLLCGLQSMIENRKK